MTHISVNATNVFIVTTMAALGLGGGMFILLWLAKSSIPLLSTVAKVLVGVVHAL